MNKTILITGTTSGVGATIAYHYIEKGWNVIGFARGESIFQFPNYKHYQVDISNSYALYDVFDQIYNIDVLINNAAVFKMKSFSNTNLNEIDDMIDINQQIQLIKLFDQRSTELLLIDKVKELEKRRKNFNKIGS